MRNKKDQTLYIKLTKNEKDLLVALAKSNERTLSGQIRYLINKGFKNEQKDH